VPWKNLDTHTQLVCQILIAADCQDLKENLIIKLFKVHMNRNCEPFFYFLILKFRYCFGFRRLNLPRVMKTFFFQSPKFVILVQNNYVTIPAQPKLSLWYHQLCRLWQERWWISKTAESWTNCCVAGRPGLVSCTNSTPGISMHLFPSNEGLQRIWMKFVQKHWPGFKPTKMLVLCSVHFTSKSFARRVDFWDQSVRRLEKGSFPTIDVAVIKKKMIWLLQSKSEGRWVW